jgi:DNA helicase-2/ATP-dependent DNA helicase PcrA
MPRIRGAKELVSAHGKGIKLTGEPVGDWISARRIIKDIPAFNEIGREVRLVRLFRATDALASGLGDRWLTTGSYAGASDLVRRILERERLVAAEGDPQGCVLMNMHKAKGKEFDGVVLVEGIHKSPFFSSYEEPPHQNSRRLLRVGITRARTLVTVVRPWNADPLVEKH